MGGTQISGLLSRKSPRQLEGRAGGAGPRHREAFLQLARPYRKALSRQTELSSPPISKFRSEDRREVLRCCDGSTNSQLVPHVPANRVSTRGLPLSQVLECIEAGVVDRRLWPRSGGVARERRLSAAARPAWGRGVAVSKVGPR